MRYLGWSWDVEIKQELLDHTHIYFVCCCHLASFHKNAKSIPGTWITCLDEFLSQSWRTLHVEQCLQLNVPLHLNPYLLHYLFIYLLKYKSIALSIECQKQIYSHHLISYPAYHTKDESAYFVGDWTVWTVWNSRKSLYWSIFSIVFQIFTGLLKSINLR